MHEALQKLPRGWFHHAEQVIALVEQHKPMVTVELGTHRGGSVVALARVVRAWGGVVYCVDTWGGVPRSGKPWPTPLIWECAVNVKRAGVSQHVRLIPSKTAEAAQAWPGPAIDFLYVDADHSYAGVLADLHNWGGHVRSGGLFAGDDYDHPHYPGVKQAWDEYELTHGLNLHRVPTPNTKPAGMSLVYGWKS